MNEHGNLKVTLAEHHRDEPKMTANLIAASSVFCVVRFNPPVPCVPSCSRKSPQEVPNAVHALVSKYTPLFGRVQVVLKDSIERCPL